jgi:succinate dehydrogenase assembly factor 1
MVQSKPVLTRPKFRLFVRYSFKTQAAAISPRNVSAIEHLLRKGRRQLETYEDHNVRDIRVSNEMREWEQREGGHRETHAKARP